MDSQSLRLQKVQPGVVGAEKTGSGREAGELRKDKKARLTGCEERMKARRLEDSLNDQGLKLNFSAMENITQVRARARKVEVTINNHFAGSTLVREHYLASCSQP